MRFTVTQEDIDKGVRSSICDCPVGLALNRCIPDAAVCVFYESICIGASKGFRCRIIANPAPLTEFISDFDHGRPVTPQSFIV